MTSTPPIPHGYRLIQGPAQKGDGVWDAAMGKFRKARKCWPSTEPAVIIRKCVETQTEIADQGTQVVECDWE